LKQLGYFLFAQIMPQQMARVLINKKPLIESKLVDVTALIENQINRGFKPSIN